METSQERKVCGSCTNVCAEDSLACSMCRIWFHQRCVKVAKQKYKYIMSSDKELLWLCEVCRKRPWHFCICSKSEEINDLKVGIHNLEHNCQPIEIKPTGADLNVNTDTTTTLNANNLINLKEIVNYKKKYKIDNEEKYTASMIALHIEEESSNEGTLAATSDMDNSPPSVNSIFTDKGHILKTEIQVEENVVGINNEVSATKQNHKCEKCGKCYKFKSLLNRHMLSHSLEKPVNFKCNHCSMSFTTKHNLQMHVNFIHLKYEKTHTCSICNRGFRTAAALKYHSDVHIPIEQRKVYQCNNCNKEFRGRHYYYRMHMKTNCFRNVPEVFRIYECDQCGKKFKTKPVLKRHKTIHTGIVHKYPCKECGKAFNSPPTLSHHVKSQHRERPACHYCGKLFSVKRNLEIHLANVHTENKSYLCDICGDALTSQGGLITHKRIHTGEKPYVCDVCGQSFRSCSGMTTHKMKHGPKTQECDECHKTFVLKTTLQKHKRIHSGVKPYKCEKCGKGFMWFTSYNLHRKNHKICGTGKESRKPETLET